MPFLKSSVNTVTRYVESGAVRRYCLTRFLGIYDRMKDLKHYFETHPEDANENDRNRIDNAILALEPVAEALNLSQTDGKS